MLPFTRDDSGLLLHWVAAPCKHLLICFTHWTGEEHLVDSEAAPWAPQVGPANNARYVFLPSLLSSAEWISTVLPSGMGLHGTNTAIIKIHINPLITGQHFDV